MFTFSRKNYRDHFVDDGPQGCIVYDDDYYKKIFLKTVSTRLGISNETTFIVIVENEYSFDASDILIKLPSPDCGRFFAQKPSFVNLIVILTICKYSINPTAPLLQPTLPHPLGKNWPVIYFISTIVFIFW